MLVHQTLDDERSYIRIAVLSGSDQLRKIHWNHDIPRGTDYPGNNDFDKFITKLGETHLVDWRRYEITPGYFRQKGRWNFDHLDAAYVSISDPDQNAKVIKVAQRILKDARIPIINHPAHSELATRSNIASALADVPGVQMPTTVRLARPSPELACSRIEKQAMAFPIIIRPVGSHTGKDTHLCDNEAALERVLRDAKGPQYLTQFVDFRSADGLYRKYRFFRIGRATVLRHLVVSDNWFIHSTDILRFMINYPELISEERTVFADGIDRLFPGASARIRQIAEATSLDYVGVDCSFLEDGRLLVFEVNATMNFFPLRTNRALWGDIDDVRVAMVATGLRELLNDKTGRAVVPRARLPLDNLSWSRA